MAPEKLQATFSAYPTGFIVFASEAQQSMPLNQNSGLPRFARKDASGQMGGNDPLGQKQAKKARYVLRDERAWSKKMETIKKTTGST
ncbi:MAG: hypothetical protein HZB12_02880 [Candidatus Yonathbacteria bacterium]|nr:hypothetical protein [Candidatus Yonathbacteria bacterium]